MTTDDWNNFARDGPLWSPGHRGRAILLRNGDVLLLPPGLRFIHAVLKLTPCLMMGGMLWDEKNLLAIIHNLFWIGEHQLTTNEALPFQMRDIIARLETFGKAGRVSDWNNDLAQGLSQLRALGCTCKHSCSVTPTACTCKANRRLTPLCHQHTRELACFEEKF
jgi:hypothetical protein